MSPPKIKDKKEKKKKKANRAHYIKNQIERNFTNKTKCQNLGRALNSRKHKTKKRPKAQFQLFTHFTCLPSAVQP